MRVFEAAKSLGVTSKELMGALADAGAQVANHMASVDEAVLERVKPTLTGTGATDGKAGAKTASKAAAAKPAGKTAAAKAEPSAHAPAEEAPAEQAGVSVETPGEPEPAPEPETPHEPEKLAAPNGLLEVTEGSTTKDLADLLERPPTDLIKRLMQLGEMVTINQPLSQEAVNVLAEEFGYEAKIVPIEEEPLAEAAEDEGVERLPRPPVVTVMGHVDHGKTLLLDAIRRTDVVSQEAGGITQHIGAYQVLHDGKKITFIDTPGHEAFTAMRARGAKVTDIAVLVVAADDGVMPQTVEAIDHARAAEVPIVVAINKIDKPGANPDKAKKSLGDYGLVPEEWGGQNVFVEVSAKQQTNIDELEDMILLVAELQEFKAPFQLPARGVAIEAKLDKGRGAVATVLVQRGTLHLGDAVVAGTAYGRVRAMIDDKGNAVEEAPPATPVEVLGWSSVPQAGDEVVVVADDKRARQIAEERSLRRRFVDGAQVRKHVTLDDLADLIREGEIKDLNIIIKGDTQGSIGALRESLEKIDQKEVRINIIHRAVGAVNESDVMLASASNAIIIGFNVRPEPKAKSMAEKEKVDLRTYRVIYKIIEDISAARVGMLAPVYEDVDTGRAEVRATFRVSKVGTVAGCLVSDGTISRGDKVRLVREGTVVFDGAMRSLFRFKDEAASVKAGLECGIALESFQDVKEGDVIEAYKVIEKRPA